MNLKMYSLAEVAKILHLKKTESLKKAVREGKLPVIRSGNRYLVSEMAVYRYLDMLSGRFNKPWGFKSAKKEEIEDDLFPDAMKEEEPKVGFYENEYLTKIQDKDQKDEFDSILDSNDKPNEGDIIPGQSETEVVRGDSGVEPSSSGDTGTEGEERDPVQPERGEQVNQ